MPTIKGPIHFKGGFNAKEFMKKQDIKIKLPFEATDFKSSKIPESADLSNIKFAKGAKKKAKKEKKKEKEPKNSLDLSYINGIGKKTVADIKRVYKDLNELKRALKSNKVPLRDDVVKKLKEELL
ncbi:MAG: hypothetical protein ACOC5T_04370 [Elusimicrobiota bacterium]